MRVESGVGAIVIDSVHRDRACRGGRSAARARAAGAAARQQRRARPDPRVPGDRARRPEVRHPARRCAGRRSRASARTPSLDFIGLHCHIGSQIFGSDGFAESAAPPPRPCTPSCSPAATVPELNLGGGFGIAYTTRRRPDPDRRARASASPTWSRPNARPSASRFRSSPSSRAASIIGTAGVTLYEVGTIKDVVVSVADDGDDRGAPVRERRRRHERQRPPGALRADYSARIANRVIGRRARPSCAWRASTARAATSSSTPTTCPATWSRATCSPFPRPAHTAGRSPATTTTSGGRRSSPCATARPASSCAARPKPTCWRATPDVREGASA